MLATQLALLFRVLEYFRHSFSFNLDEKHSSFRFLAQANLKSEWMWKYFFILLIVSAVVTVLMTIVSIILCWLINGDIEIDQLYHVFNVMLVRFTIDQISI